MTFWLNFIPAVGAPIGVLLPMPFIVLDKVTHVLDHLPDVVLSSTSGQLLRLRSLKACASHCSWRRRVPRPVYLVS